MCNKQNIHLTLPKDILKNLEAKAKEQHRTISEQVAFELKGYMDFKPGDGVRE